MKMMQVMEVPVSVTDVSLARACSFRIQALVVDRSGHPVNMANLLSKTALPGVELGYGPAQVELRTELSRSVSSHLSSFGETSKSLESLRSGLQVKFVPRPPMGAAQSGGVLWGSGYLEALKLALRDSSEGGSEVDRFLFNLGDASFSRFRISTAGLDDEKATQVCNLLTLATPAFLSYVHERYQIKPARINSVHLSYGQAHRLPGNWWFYDAQAYKTRLESMNRLVSQYGPEKHWVVDNNEKQMLGDQYSEENTWWLARRLTYCQAIEYRALPSLEPRQLLEVTPIILEWLEKALEALGDERFLTGAEAGDSGLIPGFQGREVPPSNWEYEYLRF